MFAIQTFTMHADLAEDRIRIDAVDAGGAYQAIWMTRRMADRFVPHLGEHAEKQVKPGMPASLLLAMNQEKLRLDRAASPADPVKPDPARAPWLCRTIHLTPQDGGLVWRLVDEKGAEAAVQLNEQAVRAVLDVLLTTYRALDWGEQPFPEWVREAAGSPATPPPQSLN